jgi:hypothetical protein
MLNKIPSEINAKMTPKELKHMMELRLRLPKEYRPAICLLEYEN